MARCLNCDAESPLISSFPGICADCIKNHFDTVRPHIDEMHALSRMKFDLPASPPDHPEGLTCDLCVNECRMAPGQKGYCGLRENIDGKLEAPAASEGKFSWYHDRLPTNCVGDWVCPGGTGTGYPKHAFAAGPEYGFKNLAVFYHGCTLNCLFCQNWNFRELIANPETSSAQSLADAVDDRTACICFFGGDPSAQITNSIRASRIARKQNPERILRICWETNGTMNPRHLETMLQLALESGGLVKFDLKAMNENLHIALCGVTNRRTLANFTKAAEWIPKRPDPPLLIASTLLTPGYIDAEEVHAIASFIADLNPDIPYSLLGFHPHFFMRDLPRTSVRHAEQCEQAARDAGLNRVRIGNAHLLSDAY